MERLPNIELEPSLGLSAQDRCEWPREERFVSALRLAIARGDITAVLQPIVEVPGGDLIKAEALARWSHPLFGVVPPTVFVPIAEAHGFIHELDMAVLKAACRETVKLRSAGRPDFGVSVNLSALTLARSETAAEVIAIVTGSSLPVSAIWVEATESALVGPAAHQTIATLSAAGARIALDDFGTGWATLANLHRLPVDVIKIDRSFVAAAPTEPAAAAVISSIVDLGRSLGAKVIGEGVETDVEESKLRHLGVQLVQGYRYGKGMSAETLDDMYALRPKVEPLAVAAALPPDEERRLAVLDAYQILDTPPEESFDRLTRMASLICDTPMALVSFVDGSRQWFKSRVGVDDTQTPRELAFCAHAILSDETLIVEDALADHRFRTNPLVVSAPSIRFYAGVPLRTCGGHNLGTLCVLDERPRSLTPTQLTLLNDLAAQVIANLELRALSLRLSVALDAETLGDARARFTATNDPLTGLITRRTLLATLTSLLPSNDVGVVILGLNRSETVPDTFSYGESNALLVAVAAAIKNRVQPDDIVARLAGDEFAVITKGLGDAGLIGLVAGLHAAVTSLQPSNRHQLPYGPRSGGRRQGTVTLPKHCSAEPMWPCTNRRGFRHHKARAAMARPA